MGRNRTIDRDAVLDAAERVVSRDGAAHLTLEAVAVEAGISKASVLYDYKAKKALIKAVIERRVAIETGRMRDFIVNLGNAPDAAIRGRIVAAFRSISDEDRAVGISLAAALAQDPDLREPIQQFYSDLIAEIMASSRQPRGALLALLAVEGFKLMEWFGFHAWPPEEGARLKRELLWLVGQPPGLVDVPPVLAGV